MAFDVVEIPGVGGPVATEYSFLKGYKFTVHGERVKPHGFPRNRLTLPGTNGPVQARVKGGFFRAFPALVVGSTEYPTGPATPRGLQVLALLPILTLLVLQGAIGILVAFGAVAINMGIVRGSRSGRAKGMLMAAVFVAAVVIDVLVVVAVVAATRG